MNRAKKLPLKARILQYALEHNGSFTLQEIFHDLAPEYKGNRIFTYKNVKEYFDSFIGIGFFIPVNMEMHGKELKYSCEVTKSARARGKYFR